MPGEGGWSAWMIGGYCRCLDCLGASPPAAEQFYETFQRDGGIRGRDVALGRFRTATHGSQLADEYARDSK